MKSCKLGTSKWHSKTDFSTASSTPNRLHFSSNFNDYLAPSYMFLIKILSSTFNLLPFMYTNPNYHAPINYSCGYTVRKYRVPSRSSFLLTSI